MTLQQELNINQLPSTSPTALSRIKELAITNLIGWIPRPLGVLLRRLAYRFILARVGRRLYIQMGVEFLGGSSVEIGDDVKIMRDVRFDMIAPNSLLCIGNKVCIDRGVDIKATVSDCLIEIGDGSYLGPYVCMAGPGHIKIGKECLIASQTGIYANNHREHGLSREGIEIQDNVWIGSGVRILDGVTIGKGSVIGAGAVVTKDIPPFSIAVGVPAKVIKASKGAGTA
ncbi:acyltransferase [Scytonema sp. UIC 10036]|uniref:acyltransferase n=1 Tax=Scytonema sp. UIC 10036 TaxID=2304196 RepID=UPI0012DA9E8F|nr:DapH/DapD/GlmU-related protein [Scytonema sp. UIC 10036]MUG96891.1 acyltransferase [Scytonema sp. UIC 10036]